MSRPYDEEDILAAEEDIIALYDAREESDDDHYDFPYAEEETNIEQEEDSRLFFAHVFRGPPTFLSFYMEPYTKALINKIERNERNINTTIIFPKLVDHDVDVSTSDGGLKINTYADSEWKDNVAVLFNEDCQLLGSFASDIGSSLFRGFNRNGIASPEVMFKMEEWARNSLGRYSAHKTMKVTPQTAIAKLEEISERRVRPEIDHSTTEYWDIEGNKIYTGVDNKFSKQQYDGWSRIKIPQDRLRHNETHIRANSIGYVEGLLITKADWDGNSRHAIHALKAAYLAIRQRKSELADDKTEIAIIKDFIRSKSYYYERTKRLLAEELKKLELSLAKVNKGEDPKNTKLDEAFKRKKHKHKNFNSDDPRNKKIWLEKHIKRIGEDIKNLDTMIEKSLLELDDEKIKDKLRADPRICIYDASKGILQEINLDRLEEKVQSASLLTVVKNPIAKVAKNYKLEAFVFAACLVLSFALLYHPEVHAALHNSFPGFLIASIGSMASIPVSTFCKRKVGSLLNSNKITPQAQVVISNDRQGEVNVAPSNEAAVNPLLDASVIQTQNSSINKKDEVVINIPSNKVVSPNVTQTSRGNDSQQSSL